MSAKDSRFSAIIAEIERGLLTVDPIIVKDKNQERLVKVWRSRWLVACLLVLCFCALGVVETIRVSYYGVHNYYTYVSTSKVYRLSPTDDEGKSISHEVDFAKGGETISWSTELTIKPGIAVLFEYELFLPSENTVLGSFSEFFPATGAKPEVLTTTYRLPDNCPVGRYIIRRTVKFFAPRTGIDPAASDRLPDIVFIVL